MLGAPEVGIAVMRLIDERLKRNGRRVRSKTITARAARDHGTLANAARDRVGELLPIRHALRVLRFGRIRQKSALNQDGWNSRVAQDIESAPAHAAIRSRSDAIDVVMDRGGER